MSVEKLSKPDRWGNTYRVRVDVNGKDVRRGAPSRKLADEIDLMLKTHRLRVEFGLPQDKPRILFGDAFDLFLDLLANGHLTARPVKARSVSVYREQEKLMGGLLSLWLDEIDRGCLENVCSRLRRSQSAARACQTVKRVVRVAQERGYLVDESVLLTRVAKPKPRQQKALTWTEVELLAGEMPEHIHRGVLFLALTGLRVSEFCALTDADVFLQSSGGVGDAGSERFDSARPSPPASYILVRQSKTDAGQRQVFLCREAARLVREQMLARPNLGAGQTGSGGSARSAPRLLFPNERGGPYNKDTFGQTLRRAARRLGMEDIHPHTLRSTHMTLLAQSGVDVMIAKELMGWADATFASMLPIYRKVAGSEVATEVLRLDSFLVGVEVEEEQA